MDTKKMLQRVEKILRSLLHGRQGELSPAFTKKLSEAQAIIDRIDDEINVLVRPGLKVALRHDRKGHAYRRDMQIDRVWRGIKKTLASISKQKAVIKSALRHGVKKRRYSPKLKQFDQQAKALGKRIMRMAKGEPTTRDIKGAIAEAKKLQKHRGLTSISEDRETLRPLWYRKTKLEEAASSLENALAISKRPRGSGREFLWPKLNKAAIALSMAGVGY